MAQPVAMTRAAGMGPLPELLEACEGTKAVTRVFASQGLPLTLIEERHHWTPLSALAGLFQRAARSAGDPLFGLRVGLRMRPGEYGLWVRYAMQAPTLEDAVRRLDRFLHLHQIGGTMVLKPRPTGRIAWEYDHPGAASSAYMHHSDHVIPVMIRFAQAFLGACWIPDAIEVGYGDPKSGHGRRDETGAPWLFGRTCVALVMSENAVGARRDAGRHAHDAPATVTPVEVLASHRKETARTLPAQIGATISLRLLDGRTDIDGAALLLGIGRRSLQRALEAEGLCYRVLLDRLRMSRAEALILSTDKPLTEIALDVGYSDPAHFTRAFGRHFGHPPSHLRRRENVTAEA